MTTPNILVGNSKGDIKLFSSLDGTFRSQLYSHRRDVSGIELDYKNQLIISTGIDSKILVQQEKGERPIRVQKKAHFSMEISQLRVALKFNLIATAAESMILIWNYDNFKLRGVCFYKKNEIRRFEFLDNELLIVFH